MTRREPSVATVALMVSLMHSWLLAYALAGTTHMHTTSQIAHATINDKTKRAGTVLSGFVT